MKHNFIQYLKVGGPRSVSPSVWGSLVWKTLKNPDLKYNYIVSFKSSFRWQLTKETTYTLLCTQQQLKLNSNCLCVVTACSSAYGNPQMCNSVLNERSYSSKDRAKAWTYCYFTCIYKYKNRLQ